MIVEKPFCYTWFWIRLMISSGSANRPAAFFEKIKRPSATIS